MTRHLERAEQEHLQPKCVNWKVIALSIAIALAPFGIGLCILQNYYLNRTSSAEATSFSTTIAALGRLEPKGEVINVSATPSSDGIGIKVAQLLVTDGTRVRSQEVIAVLNNRDRLLAAWEQAKQQVEVAKANLNKVKAGAKKGQIVAQQATIARLQAQLRGEIVSGEATIIRLGSQLEGEKKSGEAKLSRLEAQLRNAQAEFRRYNLLHKEGVIEDTKFDTKKLEMETAIEQIKEAKAINKQTIETLQQQINAAKATHKQTIETLQQQIKEAQGTLNQTIEIRPTDLQAAQAEVYSAIAALKKAKADLALAYVRSPIAGQVLKIYARLGETVGDKGIAAVGQTNEMFVVAEVYESDINRVRVGQRATVTSSAFRRELKGTVTKIGSQIQKNSIFDTDPSSDMDVRVVQVKIRLDPADSVRVANLTNLQVETVIHVLPSPIK